MSGRRGRGGCSGHQQRSRLLRPPAEAVECVVGELRVEHPAREGDEEEGARGRAQQWARLRAEELPQRAWPKSGSGVRVRVRVKVRVRIRVRIRVSGQGQGQG